MESVTSILGASCCQPTQAVPISRRTMMSATIFNLHCVDLWHVVVDGDISQTTVRSDCCFCFACIVSRVWQPV